MDIKVQLSKEFNLSEQHSGNIVDLINEGCTIPFIARYRKEMHGAANDQVLREFADRLSYLNNLSVRKQEIEASIKSQEKWSEEINSALDKAITLTEVEDIYRPFKQKKRTRAMMAMEKGLLPLAEIILSQDNKDKDILSIASPFINEEIDFKSAIEGACDIIAEKISDDANIRKSLRQFLFDTGLISSSVDPKQTDEQKKNTYSMYFEFNEKISSIPSHRILAINRGENDACLKVEIVADMETALNIIKRTYKKDSIFNEIMESAIEDSYKRLIFPSIEREVRNELTDKASEQAIKMFEVNLKPLLMQPPLRGKIIMSFDPAYRTGCKVAVIDQNGNVLDHTVIYATLPSESMLSKAKEMTLSLIKKHNVNVIAIGNGTASKETEIFIANIIKENNLNVSYIMVNESGASVYSASKLASEEFPDFDVTTRSAVSIARRLLDPLAELIKIDVKSIGVGQYQHDMPQKRLTEVLTGVVEDCVNSVGVDLNTASYSLLSYVSGLNSSIAKNIVKMREKGEFKNRMQLLEVNKLGKKAFIQCAGFLRISNGDSVLDNTSVHPESYEAVNKLLKMFSLSEKNILDGSIKQLKEMIAKKGYERVASECNLGVPTLTDIVEELIKPGRDIRDSLPQPVLRDDIMDINSLKEGMELNGVVRNVIDFGAFIDIGVHQDGLVHISEISDSYIKHPLDALTVGESVRVKVISLDKQKNRIGLSIKQALKQKSLQTQQKSNKNKSESESLSQMLKKLKDKFSR